MSIPPPISQRARGVASLRALLRESLATADHDLTHVPIERGVVLLAIPMVLEMAMEAVFAITDIFWVASLGADAVAAVGLTEAVMTLVYAVAVGLGMGVTALVARRVGEGDDEGAARVAGQTLWLGAAASALVATAGIGYGVDILRLMGADAGIIGGAAYTRVLLGGSLTVVYIFLLNAAFRGAGLPGIAMRALVLANAINIVLDPCLIFGLGPFPELGVAGAAVATTLGRGVAVAWLLVKLFERSPHLCVAPRHLAVDWRVMRRLVEVSLGGIGQFLVATASWVFLMRLVAAYGALAIAGYTIAVRIFDFTFLPAWGLSNSAATLVGQNLGAGQPARARAAVAVVMRYTLAYMGLVALAFLLADRALVGMFTADAAIVDYGADCLRIVALGYLPFALGMVLAQAFNGAGDTWTPTWINLLAFWALQIPLAWTLARVFGLGPRGVFVAITVAESALAVLAWWQYRRGRWARTAV
ncbi:MAG: MATE family efflux transporter [Gammaproteobacteria bacterium]